MENNVLKVRKHNLQSLLYNKFKGNIKSLAAAINLSYSSTSKYLSETDTGRDIHSGIARAIEEKLKLPSYYLDSYKHGLQSIYYIMLKVTGNHVTDVVKMLLEYTEVQECSAILGDFDIFAKIEVEQADLLELLLKRVSKFPGVLRTRTFTSIDSIHWQRNQVESFRIKEKAQVFDNFADKYIYQRINKHFEDIRAIKSTGEVVIPEKNIDFDRSEMLSYTRKEILAVRLEVELSKNNETYLNAERECIADGIKSKRIIILNEKNILRNFEAIKIHGKELKEIGCEVKFLLEQDWSPTQYSQTPESFAIFDGEFVYVQRDAMQLKIIRTQPGVVLTYRAAFVANWEKTFSCEELDSLYLNLLDKKS